MEIILQCLGWDYVSRDVWMLSLFKVTIYLSNVQMWWTIWPLLSLHDLRFTNITLLMPSNRTDGAQHMFPTDRHVLAPRYQILVTYRTFPVQAQRMKWALLTSECQVFQKGEVLSVVLHYRGDWPHVSDHRRDRHRRRRGSSRCCGPLTGWSRIRTRPGFIHSAAISSLISFSWLRSCNLFPRTNFQMTV